MKISALVQSVINTVRKPSQPKQEPPSSPDAPPPTEPGGGGTTNPPSAPFDPNQVIFKTQPQGQDSPTQDLKLEGIALAEDPDAGGEAAPSSGALQPPVSGLKVEGIALAEDPDAGGEAVPSSGALQPPVSGLKVEGIALAEDPDAGGEAVPGTGAPQPPPSGLKVEGVAMAEDPDAGGEVIPGESVLQPPFSGSKVEGIALTEGPDAGGEATGTAFEPSRGWSGSDRLTRASSDPEEGGESGFDLKVEDLKPMGMPTGVPLPYPNVDDGPDGVSGLAESVARKAGEGQRDFLKVTMDDAMVTSRDAGGGRTEVKDAHDRHANTDLAADPDDDDPEPSTLLELADGPAAEMKPGLATAVEGDIGSDLLDDLDGDHDPDGDDIDP